MPIIPLITDAEENFESLFINARECGVHYVLPGTLYLKGKTRQHFFDFIASDFPDLVDEFKSLYKKGGADHEYKNNLYAW